MTLSSPGFPKKSPQKSWKEMRNRHYYTATLLHYLLLTSVRFSRRKTFFVKCHWVSVDVAQNSRHFHLKGRVLRTALGAGLHGNDFSLHLIYTARVTGWATQPFTEFEPLIASVTWFQKSPCIKLSCATFGAGFPKKIESLSWILAQMAKFWRNIHLESRV